MQSYAMEVDADNLCTALLKLDSSIRFVGIANKMGRPVAAKFRKGLRPLLNGEELKSYAMKATLRMKTSEDYQSRLGKIIYTYALYEKVKRASIPLDDGHFSLLMVAFDVTANHESIILKKILPRIKQHRLVAEA
jgi:hypothetical protein